MQGFSNALRWQLLVLRQFIYLTKKRKLILERYRCFKFISVNL